MLFDANMKQLSPTRQFLLLLIGVTVFRLLWHLLLNPVGLMGDEAYNWDWGRHLAWGYYSKPPGSAWLHSLIGFISCLLYTSPSPRDRG